MKTGKGHSCSRLVLLNIFAFCFHCAGFGQADSAHSRKSQNEGARDVINYQNQRDLIDLAYKVFNRNPNLRVDSTGNKNTKLYFSAAPIVEYTIATGFTFGIASNVAFKTNVNKQTNTSSFLGAIKYTQKKQFLAPIQSSVWTPGNKYNFVGDWRYLDYPQDTYGFGGYTKLSDKYTVYYHYVRFYETLLRRIAKDLYTGMGYQLDYHWGITETKVQPGRVTDFQKYGFRPTSASSGLSLDFLYDSRQNSINPQAGSFYAHLQLSQNTKLLGANSNWNSVMVDVRHYIKMPVHTILALWCYSVFTLSGNPPYLDLPGTGSDMYNNTGRGYEQARFIGKKMIDLEAEFRFDISRNGLLGGVVFANAESLSELQNNKLEVISPAVGFGLRIKFNKFSGTNVCLDYGVGTKGSRGFAGNLGETF